MKLSQSAIHSHRHTLSIFCSENTKRKRQVGVFCLALFTYEQKILERPIYTSNPLAMHLLKDCRNFSLVYSEWHLTGSFLRLSAGTERSQWWCAVVFHADTPAGGQMLTERGPISDSGHPLCVRAVLTHPEPILHGLGVTSWQILLTTHCTTETCIDAILWSACPE